MADYISHSAEETEALGVRLGKQLQPNTTLCFFGNLGAGKTTFIKGLVAGAQGTFDGQVTSPTFTYLNIYEGVIPFYHFDLYRLRDADEFLSMGFEEMFYADGICCVEWAEKIVEILPSEIVKIHIEHLGEDKRKISVE
jgi:tRNA threonylcarbamoyladenosine biosynthesis protein TsaE